MARRIRSPEKISGRVPRCAGGAFESSSAMAPAGRIRRFVGEDFHDENAVSASAFLRRFRRGRRRPLPDEARGTLFLVSDLARAAGGSRRGLEADRCAAAPPEIRSEERRVGKESRSRWSPVDLAIKEDSKRL